MKTQLKRMTTRGKEGMALFAVLAILSGVAMLGSTMFVITATDVKISANFRREAQAFYFADSGLNYIKGQIESLLAAGSLALDNASENVNITAPGGYEFDVVTNLSRQVDLATNDIYYFTVTGRSSNANTRVEATFRRKPAMTMGVFADDSLDTKNGAEIYSYYSSKTPNPTAADSTHEASVGANGLVTTHVAVLVDGDLLLGANAFGTDGVRADPGDGSTVSGQENLHVGRVEPDPLGAVGGSLAATFTQVSTVNNNAGVGISGDNKIMHAMTLTSGNYYISEIQLDHNDALTIDASSGPVNIYLYGKAEFKEGTSINFSGNPNDLRIFSNSSENIVLKHDGDFRGLIYAPYAYVGVFNSANYYGVIWSGDTEAKNTGDVFIDLDMLNRFLSNKIQMLTWKEAR